MLVAVWLSILSGFVYNNEQIYRTGHLTYPWIVHIHAAFFVGWLLLFTAQLVLVRRGQVSTHRRLGMFGAGLAAVMVAFGVITAILTEQLKFGTPASDLPFLIVMFADMLVFGGLVTTGILLRRSPAAHKRLMLIATLVLTDAVWPLAQSKGRRVDGTEELLGLEDLCGRRLAVHPVPVAPRLHTDRRSGCFRSAHPEADAPSVSPCDCMLSPNPLACRVAVLSTILEVNRFEDYRTVTLEPD